MTNNRRHGTGQELYRKAKTLIPGGTQLLSKRPEMFLPELWPAYYSRAQGVNVWDLDGNQYIDMSYNGIGACVLGAADPDVNAAVHAAIDNGVMSTLNPPEEVELAELLCELHPWAGMARFARSGGEAMSMAVRIARAHTGRGTIAFCGYHGWHDWYLAANLGADNSLDGHLLPGLDPSGVPRGLAGSALPFRYNQLEELQAIVASHGSDLAAIVMEPQRNAAPAPGFLEGVRALADASGAVLVIDEITAGFRLATGGAHLVLGLEPDIAVFAKAVSNGHAFGAVLGRTKVMEAAQQTFVSSTAWTERIGPVAALATIRKHRACNVPRHLDWVGQRVRAIWESAAARAAVPLEIGGIVPLSHFRIDHPAGQAAGTLFTQLMLERGFLAGKAVYATYAHQPEHLDAYDAAVHEAFEIMGAALQKGNVEELLEGPVAHSGFQRLI